MNLDDLIKPDTVLCNVSARSKKHCLEILSELLCRPTPDIANEDVFARLIERERLGCTCLDKGIAFPHCRIEGLRTSSAAVMKLAEPVDFDSPDGESVDLVFGLMVPEQLDKGDYEDIELLTGLLRDRAYCRRLRKASSSSELREALLAGMATAEAEPRLARRG
jgi:PTS system nitrogen regulatory IIA component